MSPHGGPGVGRLRFYCVVAGAGAVVMALEIIASRVLAPHFGSSVYVWGSIISVFLAALALGYALGGRLADRAPTLPALGLALLGAAGCQAVLLLLGEPLAAALGTATGGSPGGTLLATAVLFGPPSVLLATVSPWAVKLAGRDLSRLGDTAGRLFAVSTAGSLAGTLGCTFVLIPRLPLRPLLALLLAATALTGAVALGPPRRKSLVAHLVVAGLLLLAAAAAAIPPPLPEGIVYRRITPYQSLEVGDSGDRRYLRSNGFLQSAIELGSGEPATRYVRALPLALAYQPAARRVLVLGMGGATAGSYLQRRVPDLAVDYVEIDPVMADVAREWFGFRDGPRSRVHLADARRFLAATDERWDVVFCDAYVGLSIPFHLATREFVALVEERLAPGGVFVFNLAGGQEDPFSRAIVHTVRESFPVARAYEVEGSGNVVVVATSTAVGGDREAVRRRAEALARRWDFSPALPDLLARELPAASGVRGDLVLSDAFAPVEHLVDVTVLRELDEAQWKDLLGAPGAGAARREPQ
jgi:spermidine synthase